MQSKKKPQKPRGTYSITSDGAPTGNRLLSMGENRRKLEEIMRGFNGTNDKKT